MLDKELDKLRDKTLSFGCFVNWIEWDARECLRFICNEEEKSYQPRRMHVNSDEWSFMMPEEWFDYEIIWHPLTYSDIKFHIQWENSSYSSRLCWPDRSDPRDMEKDPHWIETLNESKDFNILCNKIEELFYAFPSLYKMTELERQAHEKRPELKEFLIQFSNYL